MDGICLCHDFGAVDGRCTCKKRVKLQQQNNTSHKNVEGISLAKKKYCLTLTLIQVMSCHIISHVISYCIIHYHIKSYHSIIISYHIIADNCGRQDTLNIYCKSEDRFCLYLRADGPLQSGLGSGSGSESQKQSSTHTAPLSVCWGLS